MANTFELLQSYTVGASAVASISFNSIPQNYKDLILVTSLRISSAPAANAIARCKVQMNAVTTGYTNKLLYGQTSSAASASSTDYFTYFYTAASDATINTFSSNTLYLPNYAGSFPKGSSSDSISESNSSTQGILALNAGYSTSTAAITSLTLTQAEGSTFVTNSTAYLYGVKNV